LTLGVKTLIGWVDLCAGVWVNSWEGVLRLVILKSRNIDIRKARWVSFKIFMLFNTKTLGPPVAQLVEAIRYQPEGRGFDSRWCHWNFFWHNPSCRAMALDLTQPLTE